MVRKQEQSLAKARLGIKRFSKAPEEAEGEGVRGVSDGLLSVSRRLGVLFSTVPIHPICLCHGPIQMCVRLAAGEFILRRGSGY